MISEPETPSRRNGSKPRALLTAPANAQQLDGAFQPKLRVRHSDGEPEAQGRGALDWARPPTRRIGKVGPQRSDRPNGESQTRLCHEINNDDFRTRDYDQAERVEAARVANGVGERAARNRSAPTKVRTTPGPRVGGSGPDRATSPGCDNPMTSQRDE